MGYDLIYENESYRSVEAGPDDVCVVVVNYNQERFIADCLWSIDAQSYRSIRVVLFDDCSDDRSLDVLLPIAESMSLPVAVYRNRENSHICRTLNNALEVARGKYYSCIAADDYWGERKIETQVEMLKHAPENVCGVCSDAVYVDEGKNVLANSYITDVLKRERPAGYVTYRDLLRGNIIPAHSILLRLNMVREAGGYDERMIYEDWDLWLRLAQEYTFLFQDETHVYYRKVGSGISTNILNPFNRSWNETNYLIYKKQFESKRVPQDDIPYLKHQLKKTALRLYEQKSGYAFPALIHAYYRTRNVSLAVVIVKYLMRTVFPSRGADHMKTRGKCPS
ncbi:MAG: glycosyltransferase family A protein [Bacteroidota bacterium]|nr:glycosyltransferase family A protein [Bacteroidota bacterium]